MNELQRFNPEGRGQMGRPGDYGDGYPMQTIDIPGSGHKRDYAGLLEYWQMVRRHKAAVVLLTFAGGMIGFLLTLPSPRVYQAGTSLEVQSLNQNFLNLNQVNPVNDSSGGYYDSGIQTQVKIIQSRQIIGSVLVKLEKQPAPDNLEPSNRLDLWRRALKLNPPTNDDIWKQALGTAAGSVRVRASGTNQIIDVSCDSTIPKLAADFCNTLTAEYIEQNLASRWKATEYTGEWLTKQLQDLKIKMEKQEEELQAYARATSLVVTSDKNDANEIRLGDLQKELSSAQADRFTKQSRYEMAAASNTAALPDVLDDTTLKETQKTLADLKAKLAQLSVTFTPQHAEVKKVQVQIDALEGSLDSVRGNVLTRVRNDYEAAQRREALLQSAYNEQAHTVTSKAEESAHYDLLKRDVDATRMLYDTLQQRLKEASIASALRASNIRVVDQAMVPMSPYKPDPQQRSMVGLLFGFAFGVVFAVMRERADRTLQDPGDVTFHTGLPELGVVPVADMMLAAKPRKPAISLSTSVVPKDAADERIELVSHNEKSSLLAESFRTTLTSILFSRKNGERPRVLVMTSASPKEGKTTVVSNLAIALAEIGHRVLVIDGDMRRPRLHDIFSVPNHHGLSDLLLQKSTIFADTLEEACIKTGVPGLSVLASGGARRNVTSLLHSERLAELLEVARQKFDTVIVDTPPMVNIADARVIARHGDGLIMVVRSGVTMRDAALLAKSRFGDDGIPILGTILNFWNPKTPGYSYYRSYYAGYYHYYGNQNGNDKNGDGDDPGGGSETDGGTHPPVWKKSFAFGPQLREDSASRESQS